MSNNELISGNTVLQGELEKFASHAETADFERDPNQGSLTLLDLSQSSAQGPKEIAYLIKELTAIKE